LGEQILPIEGGEAMTNPSEGMPLIRRRNYQLSELMEIRVEAERLVKEANGKRRKQPHWMAEWTKEPLSLVWLASHLKMPLETQVSLNRTGAPDDYIDGWINGQPIQLATTGPIWPHGYPNWGYDNSLMLEQLRKEGESSGWPYILQGREGIRSDNLAPSTNELVAAFTLGVRAAFDKKNEKDYRGCALGIRVVNAGEAMTPERFEYYVGEALRHRDLSRFTVVYIFDGYPGFFVELN
jgi:hypothetical protein